MANDFSCICPWLTISVVFVHCPIPENGTPAPTHHSADFSRTANLRTKTLDFRGFDSSRILTLRSGIPMSIGNLLEIASRQILVGIILVGRLGAVSVAWGRLRDLVLPCPKEAPLEKKKRIRRQKCTWRQGIVLKHRNSLQKSLCPVVTCPYLCSSEIGDKHIADLHLAGKQNMSRELPGTFESQTISCDTSQVKPTPWRSMKNNCVTIRDHPL